MSESTPPSTSRDTLADEVAKLLRRLAIVDPSHKLVRVYGSIFSSHHSPHQVSEHAPGNVTYFLNKQKTDGELIKLKKQLEQILRPRLCVVNRKQ